MAKETIRVYISTLFLLPEAGTMAKQTLLEYTFLRCYCYLMRERWQRKLRVYISTVLLLPDEGKMAKNTNNRELIRVLYFLLLLLLLTDSDSIARDSKITGTL
ncbi:hypothetical protein PoB_002999100 [Plakobranchus ocellatus]|uniref:Uncharacterized protein n=1 Tax=Plakobranchus ocellatus TaxID=259542 RepID=A0AAV4A5E6_9GAST|nr:hypothetical protein PoB_002999100 [Plakobranchus ocellatus]